MRDEIVDILARLISDYLTCVFSLAIFVFCFQLDLSLDEFMLRSVVLLWFVEVFKQL